MNKHQAKLDSYSQMSQADLMREFEIEKRAFQSLPRKDSFSGLSISERLDRIQQTMESRGYDFKPYYMTINVGIG